MAKGFARTSVDTTKMAWIAMPFVILYMVILGFPMALFVRLVSFFIPDKQQP